MQSPGKPIGADTDASEDSGRATSLEMSASVDPTSLTLHSTGYGHGKALFIGGYAILHTPSLGLALGLTPAFRCDINATYTKGNDRDPAPCVHVQYTSAEPPLTCTVSVSLSLPLLPQLQSTMCEVPLQGASDTSPVECVPTPISPFLAHGLDMVIGHITPPPSLSLSSVSIRVRPTVPNCFHHTHPAMQGNKCVPPSVNTESECSSVKTGLGSSSALIACLADAAYRIRGQICPTLSDVVDTHTHTQTTTSEPLSSALMCHRVAQGGRGSGYDVATALTGGCLLISKGVGADTLPLGCTVHPSVDVCMVSVAVSTGTDTNTLSNVRVSPVDTGVDGTVSVGAPSASCDTRVAMGKVRDRVPLPAMYAYTHLCTHATHAVCTFIHTPCTASYTHALSAVCAVRDCIKGWVGEYQVEVEPRELSPFLDAVNTEGTHMLGMCPGAGGWDAVCVITWDPAHIQGEGSHAGGTCIEGDGPHSASGTNPCTPTLLSLCTQHGLRASVLEGCSLDRERGISLFVND
ncbi:hypothetical protein KIPB_005039 [Kipferlia bialata]|uniref:phosphomevalonate kinase n=1 Tax=Kipferlia bialata TaxID=797122 RepID=A0A9K3GHV9_9EUKA|nr:hypothetical protein KIPB_005039 [Kipferlia bialata]|eukprot:g5039.t1